MTRREPTQADFDKLLRWLHPDRDEAGRIYAKIQLRLIKIFCCRGCCNAEDLADKTINVVISKVDRLAETYVGDPAVYFYAVAKKIFLEQLKVKPPPEPPRPDPRPPELDFVCEQLDSCLEELPSADRDLVLRYHEGDKQEKIKNRKKIAEELKMTRNALRIKVFHLHARLRDCIERLKQQPAMR